MSRRTISTGVATIWLFAAIPIRSAHHQPNAPGGFVSQAAPLLPGQCTITPTHSKPTGIRVLREARTATTIWNHATRLNGGRLLDPERAID